MVKELIWLDKKVIFQAGLVIDKPVMGSWNEPSRGKVRGIKPDRFRIALNVMEVVRRIYEICGLASVQCFQQLFFLNGFIEGVGLSDSIQLLGGIFQVLLYGYFFNVHGHSDLFV